MRNISKGRPYPEYEYEYNDEYDEGAMIKYLEKLCEIEYNPGQILDDMIEKLDILIERIPRSLSKHDPNTDRLLDLTKSEQEFILEKLRSIHQRSNDAIIEMLKVL